MTIRSERRIRESSDQRGLSCRYLRHLWLNLLWCVAVCSVTAGLAAAEESAALPLGRVYHVTDSLRSPSDAVRDAQECLDGLCWNADGFDVQCVERIRTGTDATVLFPSARPAGVEQNDMVRMEWSAVRNPDGSLRSAPAMVVVHESGRGMTVGRMVARGLRDRGVHAFMVQLPFYGDRRPAGVSTEDQEFAVVMSQGIADVRRARDVVAVLPGVDATRISLQGTSLGGFVAAITAGLDDAFQNVFVLLAGGDLPKLVATGERETAQLKNMLARKGFTGDRLHHLLYRFEPNRLAHRISAERLWLFTAIYDTTVPPVHADSFAAAAGLPATHHIRMPANHYSGVIFLPMVLDRIAVNAGGEAIAVQP
ncbi:MAG: acetylxylan esterase [Fuerstiella sp.]